MVRDEWEGRCVFNSYSSQARGIAIFIKKSNPAVIMDKFSDKEGNILALLLNYEGKRILLESIYGPNQDNPNFFRDEVFKKIENWMPEFSIFAGDYNVALDQFKDTKNYLNINNPQARDALKDQIEEHNLIDIWRHNNPDGRVYSWRKYNSNKQSRLDYFLVSASLLPYVSGANITPGINSDHSVIDLEIDFSKFSRGKGFWKFNSSLLGDTVYRDLVKSIIKRTTAMYAIIDGNDKFYESASSEELTNFYNLATPESLQNLPMKVNPQSFLDVLMMEIRRETIAYSSKKKRERSCE